MSSRGANAHERARGRALEPLRASRRRRGVVGWNLHRGAHRSAAVAAFHAGRAALLDRCRPAAAAADDRRTRSAAAAPARLALHRIARTQRTRHLQPAVPRRTRAHPGEPHRVGGGDEPDHHRSGDGVGVRRAAGRTPLGRHPARPDRCLPRARAGRSHIALAADRDRRVADARRRPLLGALHHHQPFRAARRRRAVSARDDHCHGIVGRADAIARYAGRVGALAARPGGVGGLGEHLLLGGGRHCARVRLVCPRLASARRRPHFGVQQPGSGVRCHL